MGPTVEASSFPSAAPSACPEIDALAADATCSTDGDQILTYQANTHNDEPEGDVIHSLTFDDDAHTVSFSVTNPYGDDHDVYVLYDEDDATGSAGAGDAVCAQTGCSATYTAKCLSYNGIHEYTVVTVYAVGASARASIFEDSTSANLHECCPLDGDEQDPDDGLAAWTYVINCCPSGVAQARARRNRNLRRRNL